ncbi:MAG: hypothetical protein R6V62_11045 [Candidatus Fermentibacteraceae bacterium]
MRERIIGVVESIEAGDNLQGQRFDSPRVLSESARKKMDSLLPLGAEAVPILVKHARMLYHEMLKLDEEEKQKKEPAPKPKKGFLSSIFGKKAPEPPPAPVMTSWVRRTQVKAVIYGLGKFCENPETRHPQAMELLQQFSQTRHYDIFDDARSVLQQLGVTEKDVWSAVLNSLPIVPDEPGDRTFTLDQVIPQLENTQGFHLVSRRRKGDHFSIGLTTSNSHDVYRVSEHEFAVRTEPV